MKTKTQRKITRVIRLVQAFISYRRFLRAEAQKVVIKMNGKII